MLYYGCKFKYTGGYKNISVSGMFNEKIKNMLLAFVMNQTLIH